MNTFLTGSEDQRLTARPILVGAGRLRLAALDLLDAFRLRRLVVKLGWLDIRLKYRGSMLGPLWLTISTGIMVGALGFLYSALFKIDLHDYLPFLAVSLVLWNFISSIVTGACICVISNEGTIRAIRMPFGVYAGRTIVNEVITLAHNLIIIVAVLVIFSKLPGVTVLLAIPAFALWLVDALALCLLLGPICARFRDIPPIVASVLQIAFFVTPIMWMPSALGASSLHWLWLNPFHALIEIMRGPLLNEVPSRLVWASALGYSAGLWLLAVLLFVRVRGRLAFWI